MEQFSTKYFKILKVWFLTQRLYLFKLFVSINLPKKWLMQQSLTLKPKYLGTIPIFRVLFWNKIHIKVFSNPRVAFFWRCSAGYTLAVFMYCKQMDFIKYLSLNTSILEVQFFQRGDCGFYHSRRSLVFIFILFYFFFTENRVYHRWPFDYASLTEPEITPDDI